MVKQCEGCKRILPLGEFYSHSGMKDGYLNFCKTCVKNKVNNYRLYNIEKIRKYDRQRGQLKHRIENGVKYTKQYRQKYSKRYKATNIVNNALRDGKIKRRKCCELCGKLTKTIAHHKNYLQPLQVVWLCYVCHKQIHLKG